MFYVPAPWPRPSNCFLFLVQSNNHQLETFQSVEVLEGVLSDLVHNFDFDDDIPGFKTGKGTPQTSFNHLFPLRFNTF